MFTLPPRPPKDYVIEEVPKTQLSSDTFSPLGLPRVTQPTLGLFCFPIEYSDSEVPDNKIEPVNPTVLDRWVNKDRAFWVDKPGKNAYMLHHICNKYNVTVVDSYDPRYKAKEHVFNRSFKYEFDCLEDARLQKLREKCCREESEKEEHIKILERKEKEKDKPPFKLIPCKAEKPFWWNLPESKEQKLISSSFKIKDNVIVPQPETTTYRETYVRWQEEPDLLKYRHTDPCQRRLEMLMVGQQFHSEACNWYYENYPPPAIKFRHKRFA